VLFRDLSSKTAPKALEVPVEIPEELPMHLESLDLSFKPFDAEAEADDCLSEFPYYVAQPTLESLRLLTKIHLSPLGSKKLMLLSSPHPGSKIMLSKLVDSVAQNCQASKLELDFAWFVREYEIMQKYGWKEPSDLSKIASILAQF
jgi:hypothetical protein